jgi:hypothetical protein
MTSGEQFPSSPATYVEIPVYGSGGNSSVLKRCLPLVLVLGMVVELKCSKPRVLCNLSP